MSFGAGVLALAGLAAALAAASLRGRPRRVSGRAVAARVRRELLAREPAGVARRSSASSSTRPRARTPARSAGSAIPPRTSRRTTCPLVRRPGDADAGREGHRHPRRQQLLQRDHGRDRARGVRPQLHLVHGRDVPLVGAARRLPRAQVRHPDRPCPRDRARRCPRSGQPGAPRRQQQPHRSRPLLGLDEVHGARAAVRGPFGRGRRRRPDTEPLQCPRLAPRRAEPAAVRAQLRLRAAERDSPSGNVPCPRPGDRRLRGLRLVARVPQPERVRPGRDRDGGRPGGSQRRPAAQRTPVGLPGHVRLRQGHAGDPLLATDVDAGRDHGGCRQARAGPAARGERARAVVHGVGAHDPSALHNARRRRVVEPDHAAGSERAGDPSGRLPRRAERPARRPAARRGAGVAPVHDARRRPRLGAGRDPGYGGSRRRRARVARLSRGRPGLRRHPTGSARCRRGRAAAHG